MSIDTSYRDRRLAERLKDDPAFKAEYERAQSEIAQLPKELLISHALGGLGFEVRQMRETPAGNLDLPKALKHIEDELARIARGEVSENDLCY